MKNMFDVLRFNSAFPSASRAALRGFTSSLCFMISALASRHISQERSGKPVDETLEHRASVTGGEIDSANEATDAAEGREVEAQQREEQGFAQVEEPLVVAGFLKNIYNWCAAELLEHAAKRRMPDDTVVPDAYHLASTMESALSFRVNAPVKVDKAAVKAKAEMYGITEAEIEGPIIARAKRQAQATARDAERIVEIFKDLCGKGTDGHELEAEASFDRLHPLVQVRVLVALDKAIFNAYKNAVADDVQGTRPDAAGDAMHLNGMRWEVRKVNTHLMKDEKFQREYTEAASRVAAAPVWSPEPMKAIVAVKKAA